MHLAAFDVDMWRIHGYSERDGRICYNAPEWPMEAILSHPTILIEIASPTMTGKGPSAAKKAQAFNRRRWSLANMFTIGQLAQIRKGYGNPFPTILVSPSTTWTEGHTEEVREAVAGVAGEDNHDIRACRCMLFFYRANPMAWVPLDQYLKEL